ncbi:MAG: GNAT family N-acetyltransferase [Planctomycetota bacterium]|jgi:GNAT superfamily N-acetyltransferase
MIKEIPLDWWKEFKRPATLQDWKDYTYMSFRKDLKNIPVHPVADGYRIRHYQNRKDRENWATIWQAASLKGWDWGTPEGFDADFGRDQKILRRRMLFAETSQGEAVGTVSAWWTRKQNVRWAFVHWYAVIPKHQGRGLGKALLTRCLQIMKSLGHRRAFVGTQLIRLPAIKTYLDFGFVPEDPAIRKLLRKYLGRHPSLPV